MIASVLGLLLAFRGYETWRYQIVGKTKHEVARAVLFGALKVRQAIRHVRKPVAFFLPPEGDEGGNQHIGAHGQETGDRDSERARHLRERVAEQYSERLERLQETLVGFELATLEAEAVWGNVGTTEVKALVDCAHELRGAVWEYVTHQAPSTDSHLRDTDRELECWRTVHELPRLKSGASQPDAFGDRVDESIAGIEGIFRGELRLRA